MAKSPYYDGTKLCKSKDLRGKTPEVFLCSGNRTSGKTTWFSKKMVDDFLNDGKKFALLYRFNYELDDISDKFFKDIKELFFQDYVLENKSSSKGIYHDLYLNEMHCGYAITLNGADQIKKMSHLFTDISQMYMDEFQSETNHYCNQEITKFISIHKSIARGRGKMVRYVPVYLASNCVSLLNPYYTALGIADRIRKETKFLRGHGYVLEQNLNIAAMKAQAESAFDIAFSKDKYISYGSQNVYLNDDYAFIQSVKGQGKYICSVKYNGTHFGIREYAQDGIIHINKKADMSCPFRISATLKDHQINHIMLKQNEFMIQNFRYYFNNGCWRFQDLESKEALMKLIAYY